MATKQKIEKERQSLIEKYGNVDIVRLVDKHSGKIIRNFRLSEIFIENTADLKEVERVIKEGNPRVRKIEMKMPEPKKDEAPEGGGDVQ